MREYLDVSIQISSILHNYTDLVEPYSIDEQFCDLTPTMHLFGGLSAEQVAADMQQRISAEVGVYARVGIGENKILAKLACDNFAKKQLGGVFTLRRERLAEDLWPLRIGAMFGVGSRMERHLQRMGVFTIGDLARMPAERLRSRWGVNGTVLWRTAHGIDDSPLTVQTHERQKAVGHQMTLPRDYRERREIEVVLLELCDEVGRRCRRKGYRGTVLSFACVGEDDLSRRGFHHQMTLPEPTALTRELFEAARGMFRKYWEGYPVRRLGVSLGGLQTEEWVQLSLFDDRERQEQLERTLDGLKERFGNAVIRRASSFMAGGQAAERARKIGGHYM
jgi:DNA polymerase-4